MASSLRPTHGLGTAVALVAACGLLVGVSAHGGALNGSDPSAAPWPQLGQNTGHSNPSARVAWSSYIGIPGSPIVAADGTVYISGGSLPIR